ncbi:MAG: MarR family transcriptional regulator [Microbacteriaceae bacterium]
MTDQMSQMDRAATTRSAASANGDDAPRSRPGRDGTQDVAWAIEELRHAEAQLFRRRQTTCGPSETDRSAMRYILEQTDAGAEVVPRDLARHLSITSASTTALVDRLTGGGLITSRPNPRDRRSKILMPVNRSDDPDEIDPLTARIRHLTEDLSAEEAALVTGFLRQVTETVASECRD